MKNNKKIYRYKFRCHNFWVLATHEEIYLCISNKLYTHIQTFLLWTNFRFANTRLCECSFAWVKKYLFVYNNYVELERNTHYFIFIGNSCYVVSKNILRYSKNVQKKCVLQNNMILKFSFKIKSKKKKKTGKRSEYCNTNSIYLFLCNKIP